MNSRIRSPRVDPQISPFLIDGLELTLRPVQKYPQVIAVHSHLPANAVLILFFEEHSPQQVPVPSRQGGKDLPHVLGELLGHHHSLEVEDLIGNLDRKSTRLNSSHGYISYAVFCLKKKKNNRIWKEMRTQIMY